MRSLKKVSILCAILLMVSLIMTNFVFATDIDNILDIEEIQPEENVTTENTTQENTTQENTTQENTAQENTAQENTTQDSTNLTNNATTSSTTNETKLPQTGITEDYGIILLAVIFAVASIYAYRKIKQYNVK